jgi:hypothetical protein
MRSTRSDKGYRKALYRVDSSESKEGRKVFLNNFPTRVPKMAPQSKILMSRSFKYSSPVGDKNLNLSLPLTSKSDVLVTDGNNIL